MATAEHEIPTEEAIYAHMRSVHPKYRRCAGGDHNWDIAHNVQGYTAGGRKFRGSDLRDAAWFEGTDTCIEDENEERGCGRERNYQMEWNHRSQGLVRTTEYSYSNMHPDLASPKGISFTGISVRTEMPDIIREERVRRRMLQVATPAKGAA
ncbi:hypothetical protein [Streptomyces sp. NBC_01451]|uniref:hypothetical protein n=1 Tax=Streptomyces sp. NBC_01451 TaxID=2903872 RepID=UPI002E3355D7|nr:hypothetical protein [Streptomyces sp. NBC_01451]